MPGNAPPHRAELHVSEVDYRPDPVLQERLNERNATACMHNRHLRAEVARHLTSTVRRVEAAVDAVRTPAIARVMASGHSRHYTVLNMSPIKRRIQFAEDRDVVAAPDETDRQLVRRPLRAAHALWQIRLRRREQ